jgi:hypothetical protein
MGFKLKKLFRKAEGLGLEYLRFKQAANARPYGYGRRRRPFARRPRRHQHYVTIPIP